MKRVSFLLACALAATGALAAQGAPAVEQIYVSVGQLEAKMVQRLNALRVRRGLAPLRISPALASAARYHTADMARHGFCGHDSADGTPFWKRLSRFYGREAGWRSWAAGENVLCDARRLTAASALRRWLASPGHRKNLLSARWRDVGLAATYTEAAPGELQDQDVLFVTADFGVTQ